MGFLKLPQIICVILLFMVNLSSSNPIESEDQLTVKYILYIIIQLRNTTFSNCVVANGSSWASTSQNGSPYHPTGRGKIFKKWSSGPER